MMLPDTIELVSLPEAVAAAQDSAIVVDRSALGRLRFSGETRLDLLHRMSTQAVNGLQAGEGTATILTTDIGRIIDRLLLYATDDQLFVVTGENNGDHVARYLMGFVFFQDDFHVADLGAETGLLAVYGRRAEALLAELFDVEQDLAKHHWRQVAWQGGDISLHRTDPVAGDGLLIMFPKEQELSVWQFLVEGGITPAGEDAFDYLRIESGLPRFGRELTADYIPLEAGLWEDISFSKGCYIGQEIIARMESRNKIAKQLVRLQLDPIAATGVPTVSGTPIVSGKRRAGVVTSVADGPHGTLALGYVKSAFLSGTETVLTSGESRLTVLE